VNCFNDFVGQPLTTVFAGTSLETNAQAVTTMFSPKVTPDVFVVLANAIFFSPISHCHLV
jgi:hypothetical protein